MALMGKKRKNPVCAPVDRFSGFTLIELLVVVLIVGILSAVALPQYETAVLKSRAGAVLSLTRGIFDAQQAYRLANNEYATKFEDLDIGMPEGGTAGEGGNVLTYKNGRRFVLCAACQSVQSYPDANYPFYVEFYYSGNKLCWAGKTSERANRICQSLAGNSVIVSGDSVNNGYKLGF